MSPFMTEHEAAEMLRVHPGTLANWRWLSKGPAFHKLEGKVLYSKRDLTRFANSARHPAPRAKRTAIVAA
jgi:hypothetical protein